MARTNYLYCKVMDGPISEYAFVIFSVHMCAWSLCVSVYLCTYHSLCRSNLCKQMNVAESCTRTARAQAHKHTRHTHCQHASANAHAYNHKHKHIPQPL